ncbi:carboxylesterase family protein [Calidifontibacter terrae]
MTTTRTTRWTLDDATVTGLDEGTVWRATGIRYATAARFARPTVASPRGEIDATRPAPGCPQVSFPLIDEVLDQVATDMTYDEDCHFLSVTVPAGTINADRLPVMVWLHGGSYVTGAGDLPIYDPTALVEEHRVIVVNVTYRLGLFGYLARPGVPGNLGLLDQRAALSWVNRHIAAFGGDPANVTVFGESAGADSVAHLMITPDAQSLMRRAIMMSAPLGLMHRRDRMYAAMATTASELPVGASVEQVLALTNRLERMGLRYGLRAGMPFGPQYGLDPLPPEAQAPAAWSAVAPQIDLLIGHTDREAALFVPPTISGKRLPKSLWDKLVRRLTNRIYGTDALRFARRHEAAGGDGGAYVITHGQRTGGDLAGAHTTDLPLIFPGPAWDAVAEASGAAWRVSPEAGVAMRAVLADFARNGKVPARSGDPVTVRPFG